MPASKTPAFALHYRVEIADRHAHLLRVTLTIARPAALQRVSLPVWIPGSYLVREFAKSLQDLKARQGSRTVQVAQLDKTTWQIDGREGQPLTLSWQVYAFDNSVRTAWLDASRCFFNGTSLCLRVEGQQDAPHALEIVAPKLAKDEPVWQLATGLMPHKADARGFGTYLARDYDELVDCPVEMGPFWSGEFTAAGVAHRFVVAGAPASFDSERLLADTKRICETEIHFWHGRKRPPHANYVFMLNVIDDGYGGLEHRNSTALICGRRELPRVSDTRMSDGYTQLLGLISHEYFHTWNVKRLRPSEFGHYRYESENYTQLLWFFEGFTSYYDDLLLRRAGLIDNATYLKALNKTINQVLQTPGRLVQSVAQASFDAWVKYYRQDENTPNATVSYYTKGALVGLALDLTLRREGRTTLDDVMRALWAQTHGGPIAESDLLAVLEELSGRSFAAEIAAWVHGTEDLPLRELLAAQGVVVLDEPSQMAQRLGLRVAEVNGIQIKTVMRAGPAEHAGMAAGDEWIGIEAPVKKGQPAQAWRLMRLDDLALYAGPHRKLTAIVSRDRRLLRLPLTVPEGGTTWRIAQRDAEAVDRWLAGH